MNQWDQIGTELYFPLMGRKRKETAHLFHAGPEFRIKTAVQLEKTFPDAGTGRRRKTERDQHIGLEAVPVDSPVAYVVELAVVPINIPVGDRETDGFLQIAVAPWCKNCTAMERPR